MGHLEGVLSALVCGAGPMNGSKAATNAFIVIPYFLLSYLYVHLQKHFRYYEISVHTVRFFRNHPFKATGFVVLIAIFLFNSYPKRPWTIERS